MNILSIKNLAKIGREKPLFTDVTFGLNEGDKAALIGRNGGGKSTLLSTIAGILQPDDGEITVNKSAGLSFLPQNPIYTETDTIKSHIFKSKSPKLEIIRKYDELCKKMETGLSADEQKDFDALTLQMENQDLWNYESHLKSVLTVLGINDLERKMGELSGGMIKKVALAQVLVEDTKLLLLDEPTNHLDMTTIVWLQNYLAETKRTVLMVTHDRYFLDAVCNHIYELARNRIKLYVGNYSTYLEKKTTEAQIEENTERRIESVLRVELDWLKRGPCARGTKAKARIQRDNELINREKFSQDKGFTFEVKGRRLGGKILELHNITKNFPKGYSSTGKKDFVPVIKNFSYTFNRGEKIGIFGNNGSGKSTLLNIITGAIKPDEGTVVVGENTVFAYYQQNPVFKDTDISVLDYVKEAAEIMQRNDGTTLSASQFLEQFGFEGKILYSPVGTLSGGERKRLFLVRLLLSNPNFLILDEPTNDFDIFTMNILEKFLMEFKGCLLVVSHDRYFMDKVADTMFILNDSGDISGFVGKCSEYIDFIQEKEKTDELNRRQENQILQAEKKEEKKNAGQKKLTFAQKKELENLESEIMELEDEQHSLENDMASSDYEISSKAGFRYKEISARLEKAYERWEELGNL